jgi:DNA polymerase (family 10)
LRSADRLPSVGHTHGVHDPVLVRSALEEIAALLGLAGEGFKARAYARGAELVAALGDQLGPMITAGDLRELPGIGASLSKQIGELWQHGTSPLLERLRIEYPPGSAELSRVPGLTARRIKLLREGLGIRSLEALREACLAQRVRTLPGFGPKTEQRLLEAIELFQTTPEEPRRILLVDALLFVRRLQRQLIGERLAADVLLAGAARRRQEIVTELDVVVVDPSMSDDIFAAVARSAFVTRPARERPRELLIEGVPLRLHVCAREIVGATLLDATGSEAHLRALTARAEQRGLGLRADGLFFADGSFSPASSDEAAIYAELGLCFVPPELRADEALPTAGPIELVEASHLRGAIHCHTTYSDGKHSIEEMARAAQARGFEYITITDHSPSAHYAGGVDLERLKEQWDDIARAQEQLDIRILRGTESDILADGSLDYPDAILERFDVIIASIHGRLRMDHRHMTERLVGAMRVPFFKIWGHALGRMLLHRHPIDCDVEAVLDALASSRGAIELNGDPHRLDLPPAWIPRARERGIRFVLSSDAHSTTGLDAIEFAVMMARRGALEPADVLNTLPAREFMQQVRPLPGD